MNETPQIIPAPENWDLHGTLFEATGADEAAPVVLMSSAAGVPHAYYTNFARYLIEHGAAQHEAIANQLNDKQWSDIRLVHDLAGLPRITIATGTQMS